MLTLSSCHTTEIEASFSAATIQDTSSVTMDISADNTVIKPNVAKLLVESKAGTRGFTGRDIRVGDLHEPIRVATDYWWSPVRRPDPTA